MHRALDLGRRAAPLEAQLTRVHLLMHHLERAGANLMHAVLQASGEIGHQLVDGATVHNASRDAQSHLDGVGI